MTREEAIARLKANREMFVFEETKQALDMAIEALSAKPQTDYISRADAIEAVASITMSIHLSDVICDKLLALPSADTEPKRVLQGYCKGANTIQTIRHEELKQIANTRKAVESADAVQGEWLDGWEVIRELSETRCMYNCFDENDRPMYEAMTSAIDIVRQMMGGARMKGGEDE